MTFGPGETTKEIIVNIVDDDMSEPDVMFSVVLLSAEVDYTGKGPFSRDRSSKTSDIVTSHNGFNKSLPRSTSKVFGAPPPAKETEVLIVRKRCYVTIVDDDDGGILAFELPTVEVT